MSAADFNEGPLTLHEMIKIVSLLENPPEAAMVRKALRFYEKPAGMTTCKWGGQTTVMERMIHYALPQNVDELNFMLGVIKKIGARSLLEVGSNFGGNLKQMASVMPQGSLIVSVDLPCDATPKWLNPLDTLKATCKELGLLGARVELFVGNSHSTQVVEAVRKFAPFDFAFIDGDHSYEGVKADWENYGPMAKVVAFHDTGGAVEGCSRFWQELKATGKYRTDEIVGRGISFGIGIVYKEE
jgi:cephalosporin hydroxylase